MSFLHFNISVFFHYLGREFVERFLTFGFTRSQLVGEV